MFLKIKFQNICCKHRLFLIQQIMFVTVSKPCKIIAILCYLKCLQRPLITPSLFHFWLKTHLFHTSFQTCTPSFLGAVFTDQNSDSDKIFCADRFLFPVNSLSLFFCSWLRAVGPYMKLSIAGSPKNRRRPQLGDRMRPQDMRETTGNFKVY